MKLLILLTLFYQTQSIAKNEILSDEDLKDKFITVVKDNEIENQLQNSTEVQECLKKAKFDPKEDKAKREEKAVEAEKCFAEKLKKQGPDKLKELSNKFQLENFGLVNATTTNEITEYLTDKLHKAMTGVDRKEQKNREAFNLKNKKLIDQKDYFELYTNHLAKNVMFEISRFCFEHLRIDGASNSSSFAEHWKSYFDGNLPSSVNDNGNGEFGKGIDVSDTKSSYEGMFKGITGNGNFSSQKLGDFFSFCSQQIKPLCDSFKTNPSKGANACVTLSRLQNSRIVIKDTEKLKAAIEKDMSGGTTINFGNSQAPNFFSAQGESSFDNLSSITSYDILKGGEKEDSERKKMAEKCSQEPENPECEKFITIDDSRAKIEFNTDLSERLKKQAEIARILEIKKTDNTKLKEYLEEQGYFDLAKKIESMNETEIEKELEAIFDAKRKATLEQISNKIGKRQLTEEEAKDKNLKDIKIKESAQDTLEERARMAQVVLFNNILVSFVDAEDKKTGKKKKYGTLWKREQKSLESDAKGKVDESLFAGFDQGPGNSTDSSGNESITDVSFLDAILGKEEVSDNETK